MARSNLMMLLKFLVVSHLAQADVIRDDWYHDYAGQFTVTHKGRMLRVLMWFNHVQLEACALDCVRHIRCRTFNYHPVKKACELTDEDFDEMNADKISSGWYNHGTPPKVDGGWSSWRNFTECTKTCGNGTLEQWRDCDSPKPDHGGTDCKGRMRRTVKFNTQECPGLSIVQTDYKFKSGSYISAHQILSNRFLNAFSDGAVTILSVVNVALRKTATQSSTYAPNYSASKAIDGNTDTYGITEQEKKPWWLVDLGEIRVIKYILLNVYVGSVRYNKGLIVETRKNKANSWILCKHIGDAKTREIMIKCNEKSTNFRFLLIRSTKYCRLQIHEVEISGY